MNTLSFKYDLEKDVENFLRGLKSVNSQIPTKLQEEYAALNGSDFSETKVTKFLKEKGQNFDFEGRIEEITEGWKTIEKEFIPRCEEMFGIQLPYGVVGYLSQNQKCTYNWRENYFFIFYDAKFPNKTIMHELLHFYTHRKYDSLGIDSKKFNDIKESLTVILNTEFLDLMNGAQDSGYPQHQEMRESIIKMRKEGLSVDQIVHNLTSI